MRVSVEELKVAVAAASAIRLPDFLYLGSSDIIGWTTDGGDRSPCRCAAQAVYEYRHARPARDNPKGGNPFHSARITCYDDLTQLLAAMGHRGRLQTRDDVLSAIPFFQAIIDASEGRGIIPSAPSPLPDLPSEAVEEKELVCV